ncbi:MAG TPA: sugar kinase [Caulobacteraceae bacterium]|jgi:2-dehydro-3-deoxygluconokinase|nr:sugar kinase [Caulobacteraceae bacterium]
MLMRAVAIGECMVELSDAGGGLLAKAFAGDAYNTAVYLKRSAPGLQVQFLTVTGTDPLSQAMRMAWRCEGVEDEAAFIDPDRTPGLYLIERDAAGDRRFHYWRSASAARQWMQRLRAGGGDPLGGADLVYLSGISLAILPPEDQDQALLLLRSLKGKAGLIALDPNIRPALWPSLDAARAVIEAAVGLADIILPSLDDLVLLYGPGSPEILAAKLWRHGAREIALTAGGEGGLVVTAQGRAGVASPRPEQVIDTSGAGDSFNGAYLAARLSGADPTAAAEAGLALAARVVAARGAVIPANVSHPLEP